MFKLKFKLVLVFSLIWISFKVTAQEKPNIILILTDDQSYGMMGCTGNELVQTPHLDQLADDGIGTN